LSTPRDLIKNSLRLIGVLASGESPSSDQSNDALGTLNNLVKAWSIDGLMVFKLTKENFTLTIGLQSPTMGSGGTFSTTRPERIVRVNAKSGNQEYPVDIITAEKWALIPDKTFQSSYPFRVYIEGTYPLETLNFWPIPSAANSVDIYSRKAINSAFALSDTLSLPDGYEECLQYHLAIRLAPEYGKQIDPLILQTADELKSSLMRQNTRASFMDSDAPISKGAYNIYRGI
jgi:hypothetical protein